MKLSEFIENQWLKNDERNIYSIVRHAWLFSQNWLPSKSVALFGWTVWTCLTPALSPALCIKWIEVQLTEPIMCFVNLNCTRVKAHSDCARHCGDCAYNVHVKQTTLTQTALIRAVSRSIFAAWHQPVPLNWLSTSYNAFSICAVQVALRGVSPCLPDSFLSDA